MRSIDSSALAYTAMFCCARSHVLADIGRRMKILPINDQVLSGERLWRMVKELKGDVRVLDIGLAAGRGAPSTRISPLFSLT